MARIELYLTTSIADEQGTVHAVDDMVMCFVESLKSPEEIEEESIDFLASHCSSLADMNYDVRYCVAIVYVKKEAVMSISYVNEDVPDNVVPLHSPNWERLN